MDDSFIARLGYDPVRIYTYIHGCPPPPGGVVRLGTPPPEPPPAPASPGVDDDARDGGAAPTGESDAERENPPPPNDADATEGGGAPESAAPSPAAQEPDPAAAERIRLMRAWLNRHWDTVEAMARAGEAPQRPAPPPPPPAAASPMPRPTVARGDRWSKPKMAEFLRQLAATHSVTAAAKAVGMSRRSAYKLRARLKGQPFDIAWEAAFRHGYDELAHAALELALEGEEVPHYYQGELKATHRKRSPQLMIQLLKMRNREGAPAMGRYNAAAEFWSENWDRLLHRVETGAVTWDDERRSLAEADRARLGEPEEVERFIRRNLPDAAWGRPGA